jgi:acetyl-CoA synthetase
VVGATDPTTGQAIVAFVTPRGRVAEDETKGDAFVQSLRDHVAKDIGPIAKPRQILVTPELPKTRSGKIMRRLLRDIAENRELGDVTTLLDPTVTTAIRDRMAEGGSAESAES